MPTPAGRPSQRYVVFYVVEVVHEMGTGGRHDDRVSTVVHCGICGTQVDLGSGPAALVAHAKRHQPTGAGSDEELDGPG